MESEREKLIKDLGFSCTYCDGSGARQISEDEIEQCQYCAEIKPKIADFILSDRRRYLSEVEKPLKKKISRNVHWSLAVVLTEKINKALSTINHLNGE